MPNFTQRLNEIYSWEEFISNVNSLSKKEKGDLFEYLTKLILITKPEYKSILKNVWIQREGIPKEILEKLNLPSTDEGIDLVAETYLGEFWAIQCKFKSDYQSPTYKELSTFGNLVNNYCKNISLALLVHSGEKGVKKRKLLGGKYSEIGLEFWLGLSKEDWERIHMYLEGKSTRPIPRKTRRHQEEAVNSAIKHFIQSDESRGRLIMPCGTGKSLTAFWIANALKVKSVIVVVPSLALIKQSLEDWTREFVALKEEPIPEWLVICSDESTSKLDKDEFVSDAYSLGIPTTTNIEVIGLFLSKQYNGRKVIFTTYQSSDKLAQAALLCNFTFDLAILDEAHKTVGVKSKNFSTLLSNRNISISKRIFMTATERVVRGNNEEVYSMDDNSIYGELFYQLSFKAAIHSNPPIICDYKVLTISVTNDEIKQMIVKNKLVTDNNKKIEEQEAQSLAAAIALRKATQKYGIRHVVSFHRSIKGADDFAKLNKKLNDGRHDNILLNSNHISSKKSAGERARLLTDFANEQLALMTNARCLNEGVDIPAIDCVLFADPKQSTIDIVQAAGRALRPFAGKDYGYIMLPLIVPDNLSLDEFTESSPFKVVARIIAALSTQDEGIAEEFRIIKTGNQNRGKRILFDGAIPVGLKLDLNNFAEKINAKIWERVAKVNWRPYYEARAFVHDLKLAGSDEWRVYCISGNKPEDIPSNPDKIYSGKGWKTMGDWLGTGTVATKDRAYRPFKDARAFVHKLKLKSTMEWRNYVKSGNKPEDIPAKPDNGYVDNGWDGMGDWLGTGRIAAHLREYRSFDEARRFVHTLNLKSRKEWQKYCDSGEKPEDIPFAPHFTYKDKGWSGIGDWLGTGTVAPKNMEFRTFEEARAFVHGLKLKNEDEWREYCKSDKKPTDLPTSPSRTYKNKGWSGMGDWLGTGTIAAHLREYRSFDEARRFVHTLNLKNSTEWRKYCISNKKPDDVPAHPDNSYKGIGWSGMGDWLGTDNIATWKRNYLSFEEARGFVIELKFKSVSEWRKYSKSEEKPSNIPSNPNITYKNKGWINWMDWLGVDK